MFIRRKTILNRRFKIKFIHSLISIYIRGFTVRVDIFYHQTTDSFLSDSSIKFIMKTAFDTVGNIFYCTAAFLKMLQQFNIATIIFSFRRGEVLCVLVWFRVLRNFVHTHLRHPCLACPARRIDCYNFCHHYNLFFIPRTALIPGSLAKGSWLAARLVYFKYSYIQRHLHRTNYTNLICRQD